MHAKTEPLGLGEIIEECGGQDTQKTLDSMHEILGRNGLTETYEMSGPNIRFVFSIKEDSYEQVLCPLNKRFGPHGLEARFIYEGSSIEVFPKNGPGRRLLTLYRRGYTTADKKERDKGNANPQFLNQ